jgi:lipoprotein-releasing system permease protein
VAPFELLVALRYMRAKRKQTFVSLITVISVLGVAVGVAALIIAQGVMTGLFEEMQEKILSGDPDLLVWSSRPGRPVADAAETAARLRALPGVRAVAPVVLGSGLAIGSQGREPMGVEVRGVLPEAETDITTVPSRMILGELEALRPDGDGAILGADLAASLGVTVGDQVRLVIPQVRVSPLTPPLVRNRIFQVVGIFDLDFYQWDTTRIYLHIRQAESFLSTGGEGGPSALQVKLSSLDHLAEKSRELVALLGEGYFIHTVMDRNLDFFKALRTEKVIMFLAIGLIILVACLNIVSTLILMVMAKVADIGALVALGARVRSIMAIFMLQGVLIGLVGTTIGIVLGTVSCQVLDTYQLIRLSPEVYMIPAVPFRTGVGDVALAAGLALAVSFVATLYPAFKAARLDPVEALRYE